MDDLSGLVQLDTDESYTLMIPSDGTPATITAHTLVGAYHGLESLSQLLTFDYDTKTYYIDAAPWSIHDFPRFKHREVVVERNAKVLLADM